MIIAFFSQKIRSKKSRLESRFFQPYFSATLLLILYFILSAYSVNVLSFLPFSISIKIFDLLSHSSASHFCLIFSLHCFSSQKIILFMVIFPPHSLFSIPNFMLLSISICNFSHSRSIKEFEI